MLLRALFANLTRACAAASDSFLQIHELQSTGRKQHQANFARCNHLLGGPVSGAQPAKPQPKKWCFGGYRLSKLEAPVNLSSGGEMARGCWASVLLFCVVTSCAGLVSKVLRLVGAPRKRIQKTRYLFLRPARLPGSSEDFHRWSPHHFLWNRRRIVLLAHFCFGSASSFAKNKTQTATASGFSIAREFGRYTEQVVVQLVY